MKKPIFFITFLIFVTAFIHSADDLKSTTSTHAIPSIRDVAVITLPIMAARQLLLFVSVENLEHLDSFKTIPEPIKPLSVLASNVLINHTCNFAASYISSKNNESPLLANSNFSPSFVKISAQTVAYIGTLFANAFFLQDYKSKFLKYCSLSLSQHAVDIAINYYFMKKN